MSNARQRALLSALGIQQWIPRAVKTIVSKKSAATHSSAATQLWRQDNDNFYIDAATSNADSEHVSANLVNSIAINSAAAVSGNPITDSSIKQSLPEQIVADTGLIVEQAIHAHYSETPITTSKNAISLENQPEGLTSNSDLQIQLDDAHFNQFKGIQAEVSNSNNTTALNDIETSSADFNTDVDILANEPVSAKISFRLQACEINQWIILINEDDLQNQSIQTLWQNILKAFNQPAVINFSWPLSEGQRWQRSTGAKSALNGFLFRMGLDKRVGLMSELPDDICPDRLERLPHLAELLAEPLKKRTLWHLLKTQ